ncbi:MAG TPA: YraN family protein [Candidatus Wallbacteria bacterium]|nr:YraN family protein [Candidatus Wallbacteria bacterium]
MKPYNTEADLITDAGLIYTALARGKNMNKKELGAAGENLAENYLALNKFKILKKNYRTRFGEIDIIAFKDNTIFFFEVKTRKSSNYGFADEAVNRLKLNRIMNTALRYINENKHAGRFNMNFSLIAIQIEAGDIYIKIIPMN